MSNPVSNHDIEDVLSSIRRLVAQGSHVMPPETREPVLRSVQPDAPERLVLTPDFRVQPPVDDSQETEHLMPPDFPSSLDEEDGSDDDFFWTAVHDKDDHTDIPATITNLKLAKVTANPEDTMQDAVVDHVSDAIAEEIAAKLPLETQVEPEIIDSSDDTAAPLPPLPFEDVYDPVAEATANAAENEHGDIYGDELVPDTDPVDVPTAAPAHAIDPETLRVMVADMIRAELQGEMGERITRNVRKLVRREINRVIAEQND